LEKTIFINGRFLTKAVTGVQRYSLELFRHMDIFLQESPYRNLRMVCLVPPGKYESPGWKNIELCQVGINRGNIWEQIDLPLYARGKLLFSPGNSGPLFYGNQVITFHDASVFAVPDAYLGAFRAKYTLIFRSLVHIARLVLTDSCFCQRELSYYLGVPVERFKVILLGGDHLNRIAPDVTILEKNGLSKKSYFLSVASHSRHKNFGRILKAAKLTELNVEFAAVGGSFKKIFQQVEEQSIPPNMHLLGYVNDCELKALYQNALGFIFPSIYEGFGIPVLEAMNCGCPVLCSTAASLPEIYGQAALTFNPYHLNEISASIQKIHADASLQTNLQARGYKQAMGFLWDTTARETLAALVSCLSKDTV
jgi:glycosyltransferase involved in cell wall biosynthesis